MELLVYIKLIMLFTIVLSNNCENPQRKCIELCCGKTQIFNKNSRQCEEIAKYPAMSWDEISSSDGNNTEALEFLEYGPCDILRDLNYNNTEYCYTPIFENATNRYNLEKLYCSDDRDIYITLAPIHYVGFIFSMVLLFATIMIYMNISELKGNMRLRIFTNYLVSFVVRQLTWLIRESIVAYELSGSSKMLKSVICDMAIFFFYPATYLWLNVIGFEIWKTFGESNSEVNLKRDEKRFFWYSLYVWCTSPIIILTFYWADDFVFTMALTGPIYLVLIFNLIIFLMLSWKICKTWYDVAKWQNSTKTRRESIKILLRLFFMMGLARIIFESIFYFDSQLNNVDVITIFNLLEAPLIFHLFVMKNNVWTLLKDRFWPFIRVKERSDIEIQRFSVHL